jgi:hypothetical protein
MKIISIREVKLSKEGLDIYDLRNQVQKYFNDKLSNTTVLNGHPGLIMIFICYLSDLNPQLGQFIKNYQSKWAYSQYRGFIPLPEESYIEIDKDFAESIKLRSSWKWIDPAWGELQADLTFDIEKLNEIAKNLI